MGKLNGFTLIELIITMVIVAILSSIAIPAFNTTINNSRLTSNVNLMVGAINYARSEAINRGAQVRVQPAGAGWEVVSGGEQLKQFTPPSESMSITTDLDNITFEPTGYRSFGSAEGKLDFCNAKLPEGRRVIISVGGGVTVDTISCS